MLAGHVAHAITLVPLLAGLSIVAGCAVAIVRNPQISNSYALLLAVGALLCVAPTIAQFEGWGLKVVTKAELKEHTKQNKEDLGQQGAELKLQITELEKRVNVLGNRVGSPPVAAAPAHKGTVILIFYDDRKKEAQQIENYLLHKGYSANAMYTDFDEIADHRKESAGKVSMFYTAARQSLADELKKELGDRFPFMKQIKEWRADKLKATDLQILLF
jgi:hypothetical protein